jgi:hypothetical protein
MFAKPPLRILAGSREDVFVSVDSCSSSASSSRDYCAYTWRGWLAYSNVSLIGWGLFCGTVPWRQPLYSVEEVELTKYIPASTFRFSTSIDPPRDEDCVSRIFNLTTGLHRIVSTESFFMAVLDLLENADSCVLHTEEISGTSKLGF